MQALQIWISGANRGLSGLKKKPKIWLLTGIYLLKDATFTGEKKRTAGIQAGISSTVMTAVGAPPIGPSIDLGHSNDSSSQTPTQGWLVWAAQYRALDYRVGSRAFRSADIELLYDVVSDGICYFTSPDWSRGLTVEVTEQSNSLDDSPQSVDDDDDYQKIAENTWRCRVSQWLTRDESFHVPEDLTPEQQAKHKRWQQAKREMQSAGLEVAMLHPAGVNDTISLSPAILEILQESQPKMLVRTQPISEGQKQLAHERYLVSEKEYKQALADFKNSLSETQALKQ